ncbi:MAG: succinate--CoA ligase subunit beta [Kaiparowitsia implicata GSE-PSE-MK54-09C]|jgi:succinyl-CoA synthetase beta subunit|nr:succinate--CoA ligase subunit beta [Kaiparowitsia implicata GSE-PSE-MK54-09C]
MDLLEYQAKDLFQQIGIPVLPSQRITSTQDLKGLKIPYPVVLKSQVYASGRAKAGGIRFVENTIDAVAAAQTIFHLAIAGQEPDVLLAEARYQPDEELYLAIALDRSVACPVLLGSRAGGVDVEQALNQVQQVIVDQDFSPFYGRRLALGMGLEGPLLQSVTSIIEKMFRLFVQRDLDLIEINPLAVNSAGEVMALDGKVSVNDNALARHPDLVSLSPAVLPARRRIREVLPPGMSLVELEGRIGILCNGAGLAMTTMDLVVQAGGKPANFLNVGGEGVLEAPPDALAARVEAGLALLGADRTIKAVLINVLGGVTGCGELAAAIARGLQSLSPPQRSACVVRLLGRQFEAAQAQFEDVAVPLYENLDEAIAQVVAQSQGKTG